MREKLLLGNGNFEPYQLFTCHSGDRVWRFGEDLGNVDKDPSKCPFTGIFGFVRNGKWKSSHDSGGHFDGFWMKAYIVIVRLCPIPCKKWVDKGRRPLLKHGRIQHSTMGHICPAVLTHYIRTSI